MSQRPPTPGRAAVTAALIADLKEREAKGIETYGRSLHTFNGRDPAQDLVEELLDAAQYAKQLQMERQALTDELKWALGFVEAQLPGHPKAALWKEILGIADSKPQIGVRLVDGLVYWVDMGALETENALRLSWKCPLCRYTTNDNFHVSGEQAVCSKCSEGATR